MYYLIDQNGKYLGVISGNSSEIIEQTPPGCFVTALAPPRSTDWWNGSNWVSIGTQPSWYFEFNYDTKQWEDKRDLDSVKIEKWNSIKLERNKVEFGGFEFDGMVFNSDQVSQGRILAAYMFNRPVSWTLANDEVVLLTVEQIQGLAISMANHVVKTHDNARIAREAISLAKTISEVEAVLLNGK